ncbi:DUF3482 domain-containing protein [Rhodoferax sp.]|uniref:DUF3482 domain-containing protein n=1 Tax=Rhodoferax sp. TaxID=50421 RepID=UPI0019E52DBF|nr:DUF3482 domain-containing protein [Rhodoferax sp.]MBE0473858.1 GTPase and DUF3482 domain-containing protein [Rhodoferax sp.]
MAKAIELAVVGHTNAGKTSLLRTLTRRNDFGEVSDRPGTTREVQAIPLTVDGLAAIRFLDTPGLEDAPALLEHLQAMDASCTAAQKIAAFLSGPLAMGDFEQEAKVLRCMKDVDAALLVIDTRETPLPKFADEIEILRWCAKPILPVLNYVGNPDSQEPAWLAMFATHGLHARVRFQTVAPMHDAEKNLYTDLGGLLPERRGQLQDLVAYLDSERQERHAAGLRLVGDLILSLASYREILDSEVVSDEASRAQAIRLFQAQVAKLSRQGFESMLELHGFAVDSAETAMLPELTARWNSDLFNPEALKQAGKRLGIGSMVGMAVGLAADVAVAGVSLGAGVTAGGAIGGFLSQGRVGNKLFNKLRGKLELSLNDSALLLLAGQHLSMLIALEKRGHADQFLLRAPSPITFSTTQTQQFLKVVRSARAHAEWAKPRELNAQQQKKRDNHNDVLYKFFGNLPQTQVHP